VSPVSMANVIRRQNKLQGIYKTSSDPLHHGFQIWNLF
jgi:hypothetical protein